MLFIKIILSLQSLRINFTTLWRQSVDKKLFDKYRDDFNRDGFVMMKDAISKTQLEAMRSTLNYWVDDSRNFSGNFGEQMDGRPRFDVEPNTHSKSNPALRRVASPIEVSDTYLDVTRDNAALDLIAHIFNPNIKLVGTKINLKLPDNGFFLSRISFIVIFLFSFFPLLRLLKKEKPEYLIIHLNTSLPLILLLIFDFKTKFILRISGNPKLNFFRRTLWRLISKKIHIVTTPTYLLSKKLSKYKIFRDDKLKVLYDPVLFIKDYKKKTTMINKYGKYLIAVGRLTKQKNFEFLINSFEN